MPEQYRYSLPVKAGDQRQLGELTGAACATLVAEMAERHGGPVVLVAPDMQNALRLNDEIRQFTDSMVMGLATGKRYLTTASRRIRTSSPPVSPRFISYPPCSAAC
jgi:transcription-repair coupling factor (superfamily II helicase)